MTSTMDERKTLYKQFLKDKKIYNLNVSYWRVKLQKALDEKISSQDQLIKNRNNEGKSLYDGNPIFSYYNVRKEKAIRIIQEDPIEIQNYSNIKLVEAWFDKILITDSNNEDKEIQELVISVFLTSTSIDKCILLAKEWFSGDISKQNLQDRINS